MGPLFGGDGCVGPSLPWPSIPAAGAWRPPPPASLRGRPTAGRQRTRWTSRPGVLLLFSSVFPDRIRDLHPATHRPQLPSSPATAAVAEEGTQSTILVELLQQIDEAALSPAASPVVALAGHPLFAAHYLHDTGYKETHPHHVDGAAAACVHKACFCRRLLRGAL